MWKKASAGFITISLLVVIMITGQVIPDGKGVHVLEIKTISLNDFRYSVDDAPVDIVFRNNDELPIRILDVFDDKQATRIFFTIVLRDQAGTPYGPFGGGKISLLKKNLKYIELRKGDEFKVRINLKDFLPKRSSLKSGDYEISVSYFNQYGDACFKGRVESEAVILKLQDD